MAVLVRGGAGPGSTSWTALLDAVRIGPGDDDTSVTAAQLREVTGRLIAAGAWRPGDPGILVVMDWGYDVTRLAWLLADLPLVLCARLRSNRVFWRVPDPKPAGTGGPPRQHGAPLRFSDGTTWAGPCLDGHERAGKHGTVQVRAWDRGAPQAVQGRRLARSPGPGPRHRGHRDPAAG